MKRAAILLLTLACFVPAEEIDLLKEHDRWLTHPVLGGPAFQAWERFPNNPIVRGKTPFEWPVNGTLFIDPPSGHWYLYVGRYPKGYAMKPEAPMSCIVLRSTDEGKSWEDLGQILAPAEPFTFEGETAAIAHAPDVQIIYADGKYHGVFDWVSANTTWENVTNPGADNNNGVGYMWADKPEGPWHIAPRPVYSTRDMKTLHGKYRRLYVSSIVRRANDWLVLTDVDSGDYFGWGLVGMTAQQPEGPYSEPKLLLSCEGDHYYPPLMEHFPAYVRDGKIHMAATSVAKNRGVQGLFVVDIERALEPDAWRLESLETLLQPLAAEHEHAGIWGQAYSLAMTPENVETIMFPSRDVAGFGTINLARRTANSDGPGRMWAGANASRSLMIAPMAGELNSLSARLKIHRTVTLLWGQRGPLGPAAPRSDAELATLSMTEHCGLRLSADGTVALMPFQYGGPDGATDGRLDAFEGEVHIEIKSDRGEIRINGEPTFRLPANNLQGNVGLLLETYSFAEISEFRVKMSACDGCGARVAWLAEEALLGAAQGDNVARWERTTALPFRFGYGYESQAPDVRAKWNVVGTGFTLWSPRGPGLGVAEVLIDGEKVAEVDLGSVSPVASAPLYQSAPLAHAGHAIVVRPKQGRIVIDSLEARW